MHFFLIFLISLIVAQKGDRGDDDNKISSSIKRLARKETKIDQGKFE